MNTCGLKVGVNAQLKAMGIVSDSIRFCALNNDVIWRGISFEESGNDDTLAYCIIADMNVGNVEKGSIICSGSSPTITHSRFSCNKGGTLYCENSSVKVAHCSFNDNIAEKGGAIYGININALVLGHPVQAGKAQNTLKRLLQIKERN